MIKRVLISVTDKTGVVDFARGLHELGAAIISTGGTARMIREAGVPVQDVAEVTGFPEMLDGRVKTMHPRIAAGMLAIRGRADHMQAIAEHGIEPIDMVVVNLYRFEEVAAKAGAHLEELIENIDIGGPTMIRAAAKNYQDVAVVVSPGDYAAVLEEMRSGGGTLSHETNGGWPARPSARPPITMRPSARVWTATTAKGRCPRDLRLRAPKIMDLRYGENPHQSAALYGVHGKGIAGARQLQGKELSYNNLVDLDAAWQLACEFPGPAVAIIKHTNPCGCAEQPELVEAWRKALECDPVSAYGGVIGINRPVHADTAREMAKTLRGGCRGAGLFTRSARDPGREEEPAPDGGGPRH